MVNGLLTVLPISSEQMHAGVGNHDTGVVAVRERARVLLAPMRSHFLLAPTTPHLNGSILHHLFRI